MGQPWGWTSEGQPREKVGGYADHRPTFLFKNLRRNGEEHDVRDCMGCQDAFRGVKAQGML